MLIIPMFIIVYIHILSVFVRAGLTAGNGISTKHKVVFVFVCDRCTVSKASIDCTTN